MVSGWKSFWVLAFISARFHKAREQKSETRLFASNRESLAETNGTAVQNLIFDIWLINRDFCSVTIMSKQNEIWFVSAMIIFYSSLASPPGSRYTETMWPSKRLFSLWWTVMGEKYHRKKYWIKHIWLCCVRRGAFLSLQPEKIKILTKLFVRDYFVMMKIKIPFVLLVWKTIKIFVAECKGSSATRFIFSFFLIDFLLIIITCSKNLFSWFPSWDDGSDNAIIIECWIKRMWNKTHWAWIIFFRLSSEMKIWLFSLNENAENSPLNKIIRI